MESPHGALYNALRFSLWRAKARFSGPGCQT
jgi:hypothetical protein